MAVEKSVINAWSACSQGFLKLSYLRVHFFKGKSRQPLDMVHLSSNSRLCIIHLTLKITSFFSCSTNKLCYKMTVLLNYRGITNIKCQTAFFVYFSKAKWQPQFCINPQVTHFHTHDHLTLCSTNLKWKLSTMYEYYTHLHNTYHPYYNTYYIVVSYIDFYVWELKLQQSHVNNYFLSFTFRWLSSSQWCRMGLKCNRPDVHAQI